MLNDQTVHFQTIQFSIIRLFALNLNFKLIFDPKIGIYKVVLVEVRVNQGAMGIKG